jgi:protein ImuB
MRERSVCRRVLTLARLIRELERLPVSLLPESEPFADWLDGIGCHTLAGLRRLPRAGLKRRCGSALPDVVDQAYGEAPDNFVWVQAPLAFAGRLELPERVETVDALLFAGRRLLLQMTGWLVAQHKAVASFTLLLEHERGREAIPATPIEVALAEPAWQPEHLLRLLKERLARVDLAAPVIAVRLDAGEVREMAPVTDSLFQDAAGNPGNSGDAARLVELLGARLGADNVLQFTLSPDHRPEIANAWTPVDPKAAALTPIQPRSRSASRSTLHSLAGKLPPALLPDAMPAAMPGRPFWLLDQPLALLTRGHRPFYGAPLRLVSKPERLEAGWWDDRWITRDYFIAEAADAARYWIFRERVDTRDDGDWRWFLHGLFA